MENTIIINRTKSLIKLLIENNIRNIEYMNSHNDDIFESDVQNWTGRYISIKSVYKDTLIEDITLLGCKIIKDNGNSFLIFIGEDLKAKDSKLSTSELVKIFSPDN